ncbi:MAG TPA: hypothetical protein VII31_00680 [Caldimonas sp.]
MFVKALAANVSSSIAGFSIFATSNKGPASLPPCSWCTRNSVVPLVPMP